MEERQILEFLSIQYKGLRAVGLDLGAVRGKGFIKQPWKFVLKGIITCYLQFGLFWYAINVFTIRIDMATNALSMFNQGTLLILKVMVLLFKCDRLLKLMWDMNLLATKANAKELEVWVSENNQSMLISKVYVAACVSATLCSAVIPIFSISYQYFQKTDIKWKLPFDGRFPYEDHGFLIYILNYVLSVRHVFTLCELTTSIDPLFGWFVYAISGHFRILRLKVATAANRIVVNDNHQNLPQDIGCIVRYHIKVLEFIDELNQIFGGIFFAEVMMSCLQMCFVIYTLNNGANFETVPFNVLVFTAISIQMMIYCFGGEKVKNENDMLSDDIYMKFPWEKMHSWERKMVLMTLMRSQRETPLVGLFFELDRNLLVYIYRTAFSFNTLLGTMKD